MPASGHWSRRLAPRPAGPRTSVTPELLAALWARATDRDRWLLRMLAEHRVLTTTQLTNLAFPSPRVARARLQMLRNHRAVFGHRPRTGAGSLPWHYVLDEAGAHLLAAEDGQEAKEWGWRRDHALAPLAAATLAHTIGANQAGVDLIAHTRTHPDARLAAWWGPHRTAALVGDHVRPDGYLHWQAAGRAIELFVEYDTGTEPHKTLLAKTDRYTRLAEATAITLPVLLLLPTPAREAALRRALTGTPVLIATTTRQHLHAADGAAGPAWQPLTRTGARLRLADLPTPPATGTTPLHTRPEAHLGRPAPDPTPPAVPARGWAA
jgi:hypothetical protein